MIGPSPSYLMRVLTPTRYDETTRASQEVFASTHLTPTSSKRKAPDSQMEARGRWIMPASINLVTIGQGAQLSLARPCNFGTRKATKADFRFLQSMQAMSPCTDAMSRGGST
ncbi:hypothetical protein AcW1_005031 [Taiwanofungus camphoratus]|nr:hypothetical protein AcW2_005960 [Antrodia cinnamomea]KAI0960547.1 hypothetical protein AcW1_005031 [Antrodia cinnamomea]